MRASSLPAAHAVAGLDGQARTLPPVCAATVAWRSAGCRARGQREAGTVGRGLQRRGGHRLGLHGDCTEAERSCQK
jgi:hypothetical protein